MNELKANTGDRQLVNQRPGAPLSSAPLAAKAYESEQHKAEAVSKGGKDLPANVESIAEVNKEQVQDAVSKLNDYVQSTERTLDFQLDEESGQTVIKVYDKESSELIRQIPNELALELAQKLNDEEPSLLFSAQV